MDCKLHSQKPTRYEFMFNGSTGNWAMGLAKWLVTGDITPYLPIIIHLLTS